MTEIGLQNDMVKLFWMFIRQAINIMARNQNKRKNIVIKMNVKIILFCVLVLSSCNAFTVDFYTYKNWLTEDSYYITKNDDKSFNMSEGRDGLFKVVQCESETEYFCFYTRDHAFVFPMKILKNIKSWTVSGVTYKIIESGKTVKFFGKEFKDVFLISTPNNATWYGRTTGETTYWFYSETKGILAFGAKESHKFYWLEEEKGLGSQ